jgi:hypothetical protein
MMLTPGQAHDLTCAQHLLENVDPVRSSPIKPMTLMR